MTTISGIDLRIEQGSKFTGDLRVLARGSDGQWRPVKMSLAFYLVDFFAENEDERRKHVSFWKQNGQRYFVAKCIAAIRHGWRVPSDEIERQRDIA